MLIRFVLPCLILCAAASKADLTIEQKRESANGSGTVVLKIKGEHFRSDMTVNPIGAMSTIVNTSTMDSVTLIHSQKTAVRTDGAKLKARIDAQDNKQTERPKLVDTGKSEKVGGYDAEIYNWSNGKVSQTLWVAKNFPGFDKLKGEIDKVSNSGARGMGANNSYPDMTTLPGMVVKSETTGGDIKMVLILVSVKQDAIDDSEFDIPKDYKLTEQVAVPPSFHPKKPPTE